MTVKRYAQYLSEQAKSHGKFHNGPVSTSLQEDEDKAITKKVRKELGHHPGSDNHAMHVTKTSSGHHLYYHGGDDYDGYHDYGVHHPDGKITSHTVDNEREKVHHSEMDKDLHPSVKKAMAKHINDHV